MLKLGLFILMLYVLPETHSWLMRPQNERKVWRLTAPSHVHAPRGSCLVIPCNYTFPGPAAGAYYGFWKRSKDVTVASNKRGYSVHRDYKGRTQVLGSVDHKNCTWMLSNIRDSDAGTYFFRVEMNRLYSWSYQPTEVKVLDPTPPQLKLTVSKTEISAFCFIVHSCPKNPPTFSWGHEVTGKSGSYQVNAWQWITYSDLYISPPPVTSMDITCTITYHGGKMVQSTAFYEPPITGSGGGSA